MPFSPPLTVVTSHHQKGGRYMGLSFLIRGTVVATAYSAQELYAEAYNTLLRKQTRAMLADIEGRPQRKARKARQQVVRQQRKVSRLERTLG